jgi:putative transposase
MKAIPLRNRVPHAARLRADGFELLHRREAARPNEVWQADHTLLDIVVTDEAGRTVRPWLTVVS